MKGKRSHLGRMWGSCTSFTQEIQKLRTGEGEVITLTTCSSSYHFIPVSIEILEVPLCGQKILEERSWKYISVVQRSFKYISVVQRSMKYSSVGHLGKANSMKKKKS